MGYVDTLSQLTDIMVDPSPVISLLLSMIFALGIAVSPRTKEPGYITGFMVSNLVFLVLRTLLDDGLQGAKWNPKWLSFILALIISMLLFAVLALAQRLIIFGLFLLAMYAIWLVVGQQIHWTWPLILTIVISLLIIWRLRNRIDMWLFICSLSILVFIILVYGSDFIYNWAVSGQSDKGLRAAASDILAGMDCINQTACVVRILLVFILAVLRILWVLYIFFSRGRSLDDSGMAGVAIERQDETEAKLDELTRKRTDVEQQIERMTQQLETLRAAQQQPQPQPPAQHAAPPQPNIFNANAPPVYVALPQQ
jgi:hypothetical protein